MVARPHPDLMASQARQKLVSLQGTFASRNVVPRGEGTAYGSFDGVCGFEVWVRDRDSRDSRKGTQSKVTIEELGGWLALARVGALGDLGGEDGKERKRTGPMARRQLVGWG